MNAPRPLAMDFPWRSPVSRRLPGQIHDMELLAELRDEADRRAGPAYRRLIDRGSLTEADAARHTAILAAIVDDWAAWTHRWATYRARCCGEAVPEPPVLGATQWPWEAKVRELRREIEIRRKAYPKWIASPTNPLTEPEARAKCERIDAIHWHYWALLFAHEGGEHERYAVIAEREADAARGPHWRDHAREPGAAEDPGQPWLTIARLARAVGAGRAPLECNTAATLVRLHRTAAQRLAQLHAAAAQPNLTDETRERLNADFIVGGLEQWLNILAIRFGPRADEPLQEKAA